MSERQSYAHLQVPTKGSQAVPYPDARAIARLLGAHLSECFVGEAAARGAALTGLDAERAADIPAPGTLDYASSNAGDTAQTITVWGLNGSGAVISETKTLNGATTVHGAVSFTKVIAAKLSATALGTVTVKDTVIPTTLFSLAAGATTKGYSAQSFTADGALTVSIDTNVAAKSVVVLGLSGAGAVVSDVFSMTAAATTPVVGTTLFASVTAVLLGDVAAARTVTVTPGNSELAGIPFEPAVVDIHDATASLEQRRLPGSAGAFDVNLNTAAAATTAMIVDVDDADAGTWKVSLPRALAVPGHKVSVVCFGVRAAGGSL